MLIQTVLKQYALNGRRNDYEILFNYNQKDGFESKHYFSTYEELDYHATLCQFSTNVVKAIGIEIGFFINKKLFEIG